MKNLLSMCLAAALLANGSFVAAAPLAGTTTFEPPVELTPAGSPPEFGQQAVTRLVDWDADGDPDILVGGGDGRVWLMPNQGKQKFAPPEPVLLDAKPLRLGNQATTACLVDMNGDGTPDLVVAHSEVQISVLENQGTPVEPKFFDPKPLPGADGQPLMLPKGCGGRIDARDWDGDGDVDLVAGAFSGPILCFQNQGTSKRPKFGEGAPLKVGGSDRSYSYNVHPTLFDVNQDGRVDVAYGMNWGTIGLLISAADPSACRASTTATPCVVKEVAPVLSTGKPIDWRSIAGGAGRCVLDKLL